MNYPIHDEEWCKTFCRFFRWQHHHGSNYKICRLLPQLYASPLYHFSSAYTPIKQQQQIEDRIHTLAQLDHYNKTSKAIYLIRLSSRTEEDSHTWYYNKLRKRELKAASKTLIFNALNKDDCINILRSEYYQMLHKSFFLDFGTPPFPISLIVELVKRNLLKSAAVYTKDNESDQILGIIFYAVSNNELWVPWIIYNKSVSVKGLTTIMWDGIIRISKNSRLNIVNLGTSQVDSGAANFKQSMGACPVYINSGQISSSNWEYQILSRVIKLIKPLYFLPFCAYALKVIDFCFWRLAIPHV